MLFRVEVQAVCEEHRIGQHIGQFVGDAVAVRIRVPLEAFEQFAGLDGDRLGQILGGMELSPIAFGHECSQGMEDGLADHSGNLTGPYDSGWPAEEIGRASCRERACEERGGSRTRHTSWPRDWSSDVCSSDLPRPTGSIRAVRRTRWRSTWPDSRGYGTEPNRVRP